MEQTLGDFLRRRRARITPAAVGLPDHGRRRVPGLRREELAALAGVSADYYIRVEQDRVRPSDQVVLALGRALELDPTETDHLLRLARPDGPAPPPASGSVRPGVDAVLRQLGDAPAFVTDARMTLLAWTPTAAHLLGLGAHRDANVATSIFLDPEARRRYPEWDDVAAEAVGALRLQAGRSPQDAGLQRLIGELTMASPEFAALWAHADVRQKSGGRKALWHRDVGRFDVDYETLVLPRDEHLLVVYTAEPGTPGARALSLLAALAASPR